MIGPRHVIAVFALAVSLHTMGSCVITGTTGEGFPVATCEDGTVWYQDMDGQPYPNAAGYPVYPPGTWVHAGTTTTYHGG